MKEQKTVLFETLGCKLNFSETATMGQLLAEQGIMPVNDGDVPDVCVVNTCSVTELADKKGRQHLRSLVKRYPDALIVATGCYAQLKGEEISQIPGVDIVLGQEQKADIAQYVTRWFSDRESVLSVTPTRDIRRFVPSCECGSRTRYWLKVQDGCDYYCSYCTIPMARGRSRCATIDSLVKQVREVARQGGKEIVITGVNIGDFGKGTGEKFIDLIKAFDAVEGIERYRISSIEPDLLTDEVIEFCAQSRAFMPHFHIPLQCGNDEVLRLMRRHYDRAVFADKVNRCRQLMPDCFIGVDVMVGTRGETPERFEDSFDFVASLDLQHLHVFPYSERPGTMALRIPHVVSQREKQERAARMITLSDTKQREFIGRYLGTVRPVLLEAAHGNAPMHGFTDNYIRVSVQPCPELVNTVVPVRLDTLNNDLTVNAIIIQ
ncbi:MAG: tRNA (N(6)-L-threonylcarbamoyladenosine(37)-C(2))-methylthiotransferase MtaB [Bacteroidales bacterium]|nr:tRNA (N(6)-L-threonylcarbamoyladenosine(37)-C(2))-methylthiotransferase MtaB [Candidatus Sodaliphilus aphodohippi]